MLTTKQQLNLFKIFNEAKEYGGSPTISLDEDGDAVVQVEFANASMTITDTTAVYAGEQYTVDSKVKTPEGWHENHIIWCSLGQVLSLIVEVAKQYA